MKNINKKYILGITSIILFIIVTIFVLTNTINVFDNIIYNLVLNLRDNSFIDVFLKTITRLGDTAPTIIIVLLLVLFIKKEYKYLLVISEIVTLTINQVLKHLIQRARPPLIERLIEQNGYSYPSGHSMMALCLYGILIYIIYKEIKNKKIKILLITLFTILIFLIGLSRIYVRVHYPSDVLGGFCLSLSILILCITIVSNHFRGNKND